MSRPESLPEQPGPSMADAKEFQAPQARGPKAFLCLPSPPPCTPPQPPPCRPPCAPCVGSGK